MKLYKSFFAALFLCSSLHLSVMAQGLNYPQTTKGDKTFYTYKVESGEGLFAISRKFNVTQDEIIQYNPAIRSGLRGGQELLIPIPNAEKTTAASPNKKYHTIEPKETLYSVAKKFNITQEELLKLNPGLAIENFSVGKVICVVPDEATFTPKYFQYTLKRKETIYSVAAKLNIPVNILMDCNKNAIIESGSKINIPDSNTLKHMTEKPVAPVEAPVTTEEKPVVKKEAYDVYILLPFMLNEKDHSKSSLYVEFYEGLLMAAMDLKEKGMNMNLHAFDTEGSPNAINRILNLTDISHADLIIGPATDELLKQVSEYAERQEIPIVNPFSLKTDIANINNQLFQINLAHPSLYPEVVSEFIRRYKDKEIVFLTDKNVKSDKTDLLALMKTELDKQYVSSHNFTFNEDKEIAKIDSLLTLGKDIVIVPTNGSRSSTAKITNALSILKKNTPDMNITLFGYPEWQMYIKDYIENFHLLNTTIFSRFYSNPMDENVKKFAGNFRNWYGKELINASPNYGMMGYDIGNYFFDQLRENGKSFREHPGTKTKDNLQNDFNFLRIGDNGGYMNKGLYFITFTPENIIVRESIQ